LDCPFFYGAWGRQNERRRDPADEEIPRQACAVDYPNGAAKTADRGAVAAGVGTFKEVVVMTSREERIAAWFQTLAENDQGLLIVLGMVAMVIIILIIFRWGAPTLYARARSFAWWGFWFLVFAALLYPYPPPYY